MLALCGVIAVAGCGNAGSSPGDAADAAAHDAADAGSDVDAGYDAAGDAVDDGTDAPGDVASEVGGFADDASPDLRADRYAVVDIPITFDVTLPEGTERYTVRFGDDTTEDFDPSVTSFEHVYTAPARYRPAIIAYDAAGRSRVAERLVTVTWPIIHTPRHASTLVARDDGLIAVVEADADVLTVMALDGDQLSVTRRIATCDRPRTVAALDDGFAVACAGDGTVCVYPDGAGERCATPGAALRPFGIIADAGRLYVTAQATGELLVLDADTVELVARFDAVPDARGVALLPDGDVVVTRWRSDDDAVAFVRIDPASGERTPGSLARVDRLASDTETGGVPSYLDAFVVHPSGRQAVLPSTLANTDQGLYLNGSELSHETTVRAILSQVSLPDLSEEPERRTQFDDRGLASAAVYSSRGDYLFVAHRGARAIDRIDTFTGSMSGTLLDVGYAPSGLALIDDRWLLVHASFSREVRVYDVSDFSALPLPRSVADTVETEPLSELELRGAQLFNDSFDTRLARDGYIACAHCHLDGESDHRTWDFTDRGEGLRNTISLLGRAGTGDGPIHWSANFDEVQDFEHDIRGPFRGTGLIDDALFFADGHDASLGTPKAGLSDDLDALAAWVSSLDAAPPSPFRDDAGLLTEAAERGAALFYDTEVGCASCHAGPRFTDSTWLEPGVPLLHDVGTLSAASGQRLGGELPGLDTPSLVGTWNSGPWLHDGSAPTVLDVLTTRNPDDLHGRTSQLTSEELADLAAFVLSLDGSSDELP